MKDDKAKKTDKYPELIFLILTSLSIFIGLIMLSGWVISFGFMLRIYNAYVPMVLITALLFIVGGTINLVFYFNQDKQNIINILRLLLATAFVVSAINLLYDLHLISFSSDEIFINEEVKIQSFTIGRMSPLTAILFMINSVIIFLYTGKNKKLASLLSFCLTIANVLYFLSYNFIAPLIVSVKILPPSLITSLTFIFLTTASFMGFGKMHFPAIMFSGSSSRAVLLRHLFPFTIGMIIFIVFLGAISRPFDTGTSITVLFSSVIPAFLLIYIALRIIKKISIELDTATNEVTLAEKQKQKAEEKFTLFFNNSPVPKSITGIDGSLQVNKAFCDMLGYSEKEMEHINLRDITFHEDISLSEEVIEKLLKGKISKANFEKRFLHKNGNIIWAEAYTALIKEENDKPLFFITSVIDITEKKHLHDTLFSLQERYTQLFENMGSAVAVYEAVNNGENFKIIAFNKKAEQFEQIDRTSIIGRNITEIFPGVKEMGIFEVIQRVWKKGKPEHFPATIYHDDRIYGWRENYIYKLPSGEVVAVYDDVSQIKQAEEKLKISEEKFRLLFEHLPEAVYIQCDGKLILANSSCCNLLAASSPDQIIGKEILSFVHPDFHSIVRQRMMQIEEQNEGVPMIEEVYIRLDGSIVNVEVQAVPFVYEGKQAAQVILHDITERLKTQAALEEKDIRLAKLSSQIPGMLYQFHKKPDGSFCVPFTTEHIRNIFGCSPQDVAHDFSPIANVIVPEDMPEVIRSIEYSAEHLTQWICDYRVHVHGQPIKWLHGQSLPEKLPDGSILWYGFNYDITDRKLAEQSVKENEEKYRLLAENSADVIWTLDIKTLQFTYISPSIEKLRGFTVAEAMAESFTDTIPDKYQKYFLDLLPQIVENYEAFKQTNAVNTFELEQYRKDRSLIWVEIKASIIEDQNGQPKEILGVSRDITSNKKLSLALTDSEEKWRLLVSTTPDYIALHDKDERYLFLNHFAEGFSKKNVIGKPASDFLDPAYVPLYKDKFNDCLLTGITQHFEYKAYNNNKKTVWYENYFIKISRPTEEPLMMSVVRDIDARKASEQAILDAAKEWQTTFNASRDAIALLDKKCRIVRTNSAMREITGRKEMDLVGQFCYKIMHGLDHHIPECPLQKTNKSRHRESYELNDGNKWIEVIIDPIIDNKEIQGYIHIVRDITEKKNNEERIRKNENRLSSLLRITQYPAQSIQELLDFALEEAIQLTESKIGYIYFYNDVTREFTLNTWSKNVMKECSIMEPQTIYELGKTGIWGEAVRQQKPIILNDYAADQPLKKGYPEGHAPLKKFMTIPVFNKQKIVAVVGLANKEKDYNDQDVQQLSLMMNTVWNIVEREKVFIDLRDSEYKFSVAFKTSSHTLIISEMQTGKIIEVNDGYCKVTGYTYDETIGKSVVDLGLVPDFSLRNNVIKSLRNNVKISNLEINFSDKNGKIHYGLLSTEQINIKGTEYLLSSIYDITDRKETELELKKSEENYRMLFTEMTSAFALHKIINDEFGQPVDYEFIEVNLSFEIMTGLKASDIIGKRAKKVMPDMEESWIKEYGVVANKGISTTFEKYSASLNKYYQVRAFCPKPGFFATIFSDVTEQKKTELALRKNEEKYRDIFNNIQDVFYETTIDGKIIEVSPSILEISKYTRQELIGNNMSQFYSDIERRNKLIETLMKEGFVRDFEIPLIDKEGMLNRCSITTKLLKDANGKYTRIVGSMRNIEARKKAEDELNKTREKYRELFEASNDIIYTMDFQGNFTSVSPSAEKILGHNFNTLYHSNMTQFISEEHAKLAFENIQKKLNGELTNTVYEVDFRNADGSFTTLEISSMIRYVEGKPYEVFGIARDITERKKLANELEKTLNNLEELVRKRTDDLTRTEELYYTTVNSINDWICVIDEHYTVVFANDYLADFYKTNGFTGRLLGGNFKEIFSFLSEKDYAQYQKVFSEGISIVNENEKIVFGKKYHTVTKLIPVMQNNKVIRVVTTITDITRVKEVELEIAANLEREKELNAMKSQFISTVSHEFRTPLAGILSSVQLLKRYHEKWDADKKDKIFRQIFNAISHTKSLLDDVAIIDKQQNRRFAVKPVSSNLKELLHDIIEENKQVYGSHFEILTSFDLKRSEYNIDPEIMRHIFSNLISNAIKYSGHSKKIEFRITEMKKEIQYVIQDYGIGMSAEDVKHMFEPFYRASNTGHIPGTGFGLSIVQHFIRMLNGKIEVSSEMGKGTCITLTLPIIETKNKKNKI